MQTEYYCFNIKSIELVKNVLLLSIVEIKETVMNLSAARHRATTNFRTYPIC